MPIKLKKAKSFITYASLNLPDHYRCQVNLPRPWFYAVAHGFLRTTRDKTISDELRDAYGDAIEARYIEHLRTALATPEARVEFKGWCERSTLEPELLRSILSETGKILGMKLL